MGGIVSRVALWAGENPMVQPFSWPLNFPWLSTGVLQEFWPFRNFVVRINAVYFVSLV